MTDKQDASSFSIFQEMGTGEWCYNDFVTGDKGSCFDFVLKLFNLSFPEALDEIQKVEFGLEINLSSDLMSLNIKEALY